MLLFSNSLKGYAMLCMVLQNNIHIKNCLTIQKEKPPKIMQLFSSLLKDKKDLV